MDSMEGSCPVAAVVQDSDAVGLGQGLCVH